MAATNFTPIILFNSGTTTNAPVAGNLAAGELALNWKDGYLFYKDDANAIQKIGYKLTPVTAGGTGSTTASDARTALGLAIGTNVQAYDADLTTWAGITPGTGVGTALAVNVGSAGAPVVNGGALGTPSSGSLANCTAYPGTSALVTTGALNSGSITSGFGAIDVGTDAISGGAGSFTTVSSTLDATLYGVTVGRGAGADGTNTAVGDRALAADTTGSSNTAVGQRALQANTTGAYNTAVGITAMVTNTTGSYNTAFGREALPLNTTGVTNTAIGNQALFSNTSGSNNAALGGGALYYNTTGNYNTANGETALYSNTTASNNTAVGYQAGYSATTAASNTVMGYQAGYSLTTGNANTFYGYQSGSAMTTGSNNVILGRYSGNQGGLDIHTDNNYIVLSDGGGNPRGVFDGSGRFGINTTSQGTNPDQMYIMTAGSSKYGLHISHQIVSSGAATVGAIRIDGSQGRGQGTNTGISIDISELDVGACTGINAKVTGLYGTQYAVYQEISKSLAAYTTAYCNYATMSTSSSGGAAYFYYAYDQNSAGAKFFVGQNGGVSNYQANDTNLSDRREKTNFAPAKSYLDIICAIPVQTFNYIDQNMEDDAGLTLGVVAQDVQAVAPELIAESNWGTEEDPKMRLSIYQTDLQYALMKCIQEQQAIIESLKARLDAANL